MKKGARTAIPVLLLLLGACAHASHWAGRAASEEVAVREEARGKESLRREASRGQPGPKGGVHGGNVAFTKEAYAAAEEGEGARRERMVVYTARMEMVVSSVPEKIRQATRVAESMGGYMSRRDDVQVTVRVPSDRLTEYLAGVRALGTVVSESMSGQDVTEEYLDLEIRLRNGEKTLERLRELLRKAKDVKDILAIEKEVQRVTEEVERIKGRMKYLSQMTALATVTIRFNAPREKPPAPRPSTPFHWVGRLGIEKVFQ